MKKIDMVKESNLDGALQGKEREETPAPEKRGFLRGVLFRFVGWWSGFSALIITFTACPFCGQPGCPIGTGTAGIIGGLFALCLQPWKILLHTLRGVRAKKSKPLHHHDRIAR